MKNHYLILGLNTDGISPKTKQPYTQDEIKKAYRKMALQCHPDHNKLNNGDELFKKIKTSYDILSDLNQRAAFDAELKKNPGAFLEESSLYVLIDDEDDEFCDDQFNQQSLKEKDTDAVIVYQPKGINLTTLLESANVSKEQIVDIASQNIKFALAVINNNQLLSTLPIEMRFHLLFLICRELSQLNQQDEILQLVNSSSIKQLLNAINDQEDYQSGFISACLQHKELGKHFFTLFPEIFSKLTKEQLMSLSQYYYEVVQVILEKHANHLRPLEVNSFIDRHPANKTEIETLYKKYMDPEKQKKQEAYFRLKKIFSRKHCNSESLNKCAQDIYSLGVETFSLLEISLDKDKALVNSLYIWVILKILLSQNNIKSWIKELDSNELEQLQLKVMQGFKFVQLFVSSSRSTMSADYAESYLGNLEAIGLLMRKFSPIFFRNFLEIIRIDAFSAGPRNELINFILSYPNKKIIIDKSEFFSLLKNSDEQVIKCLKKNKDLFLEVVRLNVIPELKPELQAKIAKLCVKHGLDKETLNISMLPQHFREVWEVFAGLAEYLKTENTQAIDLDTFNKYVAKVGLNNGLLKLKVEDNLIKFTLLKFFLGKNIKLKEYQRYFIEINVKQWFSDILQKGTEEQIKELLSLLRYQSNPLLLLSEKLEKNKFGYPLRFDLKLFNIFGKDSILCSKYITGRLLSDFSRNYTKLNGKSELSQRVNAVEIEFSDYYPSLFNNRNTVINSIDNIKKMLTEVHQKFINEIQPAYPSISLGETLLDLLNSNDEELETKIGIFEVLFNKSKGLLHVEDEALMCWVNLLEETSSKISRYVDEANNSFEEIRLAFVNKLQNKYPNALFSMYLLINQSEWFKTKLNAYETLIVCLTEMQGIAIDDQKFNECLSLLKISGLDEVTLCLILENLKHDNLALSALLTAVVQDTDFFIHDELKQKIDAQLKDLSIDEKLIILNFSYFAKKYLMAHSNNICGEMLLRMSEKFNDTILPVIEESGLRRQYSQAKKLAHVLKKANEESAGFQNQKINSEQIIHKLIKKFETLISKSTLQKIQSPDIAKDIYDEFVFAQTKYNDTRLIQLIDVYSDAEKNNLLKWVIELALKGNERCKMQLEQWFEQLEFLGPLTDCLSLLLQRQMYSFADIENTLTKSNLIKLILHALASADNSIAEQFLKRLNDQVVSTDIIAKDYSSQCRNKLYALYLKQSNAQFEWPVDENAVDNNIVCQLLIEGYLPLTTLAQWKQTALELVIEFALKGNERCKMQLEQWFEQQEFHASIAGYLSLLLQRRMYSFADIENMLTKSSLIKLILLALESPDNCIISHLLEKLSKNGTLTNTLINSYGIESTSKLYQLYLKREKALFEWPIDECAVNNSTICQLVAAGHLSFPALVKLNQMEIDRLNSQTVAICLKTQSSNFKIQQALNIDESKLCLLPLLFAGLIDESYLANFAIDSIKFHAYLYIAQSSNLTDTKTLNQKFANINAFFVNDYYKFIEGKVLAVINNEIERLGKEKGSFYKESGETKCKQLAFVKNEIKDLIIEQLNRSSDDLNTFKLQEFNEKFNQRLIQRFKEIADRKEIKHKRNLIGIFFKRLAGVLLAAPTLGLICISQKYRHLFFTSITQAEFGRIGRALDKTKALTARQSG